MIWKNLFQKRILLWKLNKALVKKGLNDLFGKLNNLFPIKDSKLEKDYRSKEATEGTIKLEEDAVKNVGNVECVKEAGVGVEKSTWKNRKKGHFIFYELSEDTR